MRFTKKILILFLLFTFAVSVKASGIKVNPSKLQITVKANESVSQEIIVTNPTSDVQIFKVYPDDFVNIIRVYPASFTLEAGLEKAVLVTVEVKDDQNNLTNLNTNLSIVAKPLAETGFQTNAGVKIPLSITILENKPPSRISKQTYYVLAIALLIGIGLCIYFMRRKNRP